MVGGKVHDSHMFALPLSESDGKPRNDKRVGKEEKNEKKGRQLRWIN